MPATRIRNFDLLALDLDGTLLNPQGIVSQANRQAIARARQEGLEVVVCTGRGLVESQHIVEQIDANRPAAGRDQAPIICAGGAMICDVATGQTLHRWKMDQSLVSRLCDHFADHKRAPLLLKDRAAAGFDYLVINSGPIEYPTQWWFSVMNVEVKFVDHLSEDPHPEHTVRVGFAATSTVMRDLAASVHERFGREAVTQHFSAVAGTIDSGKNGVKDDSVHLLEVFDPSVSKWSAIRHLAVMHDIDRNRIAAIGDEVNDRTMIEGAALGIAMGNAVPSIREAADIIAPSNADDGVAYAIDRILDGDW